MKTTIPRTQYQKTAGVSTARASAAARASAPSCSIQDIDRACERFLRLRVPGYREMKEEMTARRNQNRK